LSTLLAFENKSLDLHPALIGWDPVFADGHPVADKAADLADLSLAELKAYGDELTKDITKPPIRFESFEA
jgi:hypothetical protein